MLQDLWHKHRQYLPLSTGPESSTGSSPKRRYLTLALICATIVSLALNIAFICRQLRPIYSPLDNFQQLNNQDILNDEAMTSAVQVNPHENAIVTSLYTDAYAAAIATLGESINKSNTTARRILLYIPEQVSQRALCVATSTGFVPHPIARIAPPRNGVSSRFVDQYSKLTLWTLDQIGVTSLVYLDADTLVRRNFDELFSLPYNFAAVPDVFIDRNKVGWLVDFNAGVLFLRPSTAIFERMLATIGTAKYPPSMAEQAYLNVFYGANAVRLPYAYNANLAIKVRSPEIWESIMDEARIVHYTLMKPFLTPKFKPVARMADLERNVQSVIAALDDGMFESEFRDWLDVWRHTYRTYGDAFEQCELRWPEVSR